MLLDNFLTPIKQQLHLLSSQDCRDLDILVRIESLLALDTLKKAIVMCEKFLAPMAETNEETLEIFIDLLDERWQKIRLTDASYCHAPGSVANRAYLVVAEALAEAIGNKHAYDFLFPNVDFANYKKIYKLKLHEFIFSDNAAAHRTSGLLNANSSSHNLSVEVIREMDVGDPIEILPCLQTALKHGELGVLKMTREDKASEKLNEAEQERVKGHSHLTQNYYIDVKACREKSSWELPLIKALGEKNYTVLSSYGPVGKRRLLTVILSRCNTRQRLTDIMVTAIPKSEWGCLLDQIFEKLAPKLIIHKNTLQDSVGDQNIYTNNSEANAAVLYCFAYAYKKDRTPQGNFKSPYGLSYVAPLVQTLYRVYNKQEKIAAVDVLLSYLGSDRHFSLDNFLLTSECPPGVTVERRNGALKDGELKCLADTVQSRLPVESQVRLDGLYQLETKP